MVEIIALVSNLGALTVIGFIYLGYIKNLRSINELKDSQLKVAQQNVKLWKDRAIELERRTPEFIEKQLSDRIKVREEELARLASDNKDHSEMIEQKNKELRNLRGKVEAAQAFTSDITVWDKGMNDYVDVPVSALETRYAGAIAVDTASIMICDPWYVSMEDEREKEEFEAKSRMFEVVSTGERFCSNEEEDSWPAEAFSLDDNHSSIGELIANGTVRELDYRGHLPAIKESYIKGNFQDDSNKHFYLPVRHQTFMNGNPGAGVTVGLSGDGVYHVKIESYKDEIQRIVIEI